MHTVMWIFKIPTDTTKDMLRQIIKDSAHTYLNIPGLIRKYYGISEDGRALTGIYLWETKEQAEAFYTPEWIALVTKRWNSLPARTSWETPMVVESAAGILTSS